MLQSIRNQQTLSILDKLKKQGMPSKDAIQPISPLGEAEAGEEEMVDEDQELNPMSTQVVSPLISKKKKRQFAEGL